MNPQESRNWFLAKLNHEILENEKLRVTYLGAFFAVAMLDFLVLFWFFPELFNDFIEGGILGLETEVYSGVSRKTFFLFSSVAVNSVIILYALIGRFLVGRNLRLSHRFPLWLKYATLILETSIPTAFLFLIGEVSHPHLVLIVPAVFLYFPFIILSVMRLNPWFSILTGLIAALQYGGLALWFTQLPGAALEIPLLTCFPMHAGKAGILLASGVLAGMVTAKIRTNTQNSLDSLHDRNRILGLFGQHVSPEVVQVLLDQRPGDTVENRHVCVMFLDIRDFTGFSESRTPNEIIDFLNSLFDFMIEIVNRNQGIINKFLGDGFLAVFGAPLTSGQDSRNALHAAFDILEMVEKKIASGEIPDIRIGIGLHSGDVVAGNIGSRRRKEYTVIGDVVNVASRIEGMNKVYHSSLLISETTLQDAPIFKAKAEDIGDIPVKGREKPIRLYKLA